MSSNQIESPDILQFIGFENQNTLISVANLKDNLIYFQALDDVYNEVRQSYRIGESKSVEQIIAILFLQAHNEFFLGTSQLFRSHLTKSLLSLRIAIDASFNGYYLKSNPGDLEKFYNEENPFNRMKDHIKKNPSKFPLAESLIKIHEIASNVSAHSSLKSMAHKYERTSDQMNLHYFDKLDNKKFLAHYFILMMGHFKVFNLFYQSFFKDDFKIIVSEREKKISWIEKSLELKMKEHPLSKCYPEYE